MRGMRPLTIAAVLLLAPVLGGCEQPPTVALDGDPSGSWFGNQRDGRADVLWHTQHAVDGGIRIEFLRCFNGEALSRERQVGEATLAEGRWDIRILDTEFTDLRSGESFAGEGFDHSYQFTEISANRLRYRSDETGTGYEMTRASADIELECPPARVSVDTRPGQQRARDAWITRGEPPEDEQAAEGVTDEPDSEDAAVEEATAD